jgi:hypothetical protein
MIIYIICFFEPGLFCRKKFEMYVILESKLVN